MAEVIKSVLVAHPATRMFALVDAVEDYPKFLPWCGGTEVLLRDANLTRATIHINYHGISQSFTTENSKREPQLIQIKLIRGPFKTLQGSWRFIDLSGKGCKIELSLQYEFSSRLLGRLVGPVFGYIANSLVDSFVKRANTLYG